MLDAIGEGVIDYKSAHRESVTGSDGAYEIDVRASFSALGVSFLVLIECKRYSRPVDREAVQLLHAKIASTGAHKGILFSTSGFQSGAIEYARVHGIALVQIADGRTSYLTRAEPRAYGPPPWNEVPDYIPSYVGWLFDGNTQSVISVRDAAALLSFLTAESSRS